MTEQNTKPETTNKTATCTITVLHGGKLYGTGSWYTVAVPAEEAASRAHELASEYRQVMGGHPILEIDGQEIEID